MQIVLAAVAVQGRRDPMLAPLDLVLRPREAVLVAAEPGHGHTALALAAAGRLEPSGGSVRLERDADDALGGARADRLGLADVTALVDVPGVSEPVESLPVHVLAAEDLALAGRPSRPAAVRAWLDDHGLGDLADDRVDRVPALRRTTLLAALAAERPGVRFLVLTLPDRHGGSPTGWWRLACEAADAGFGVLVQSSRASARLLGADIPPDVSEHPHLDPPVVALRYVSPEPEPEPEPESEPADRAPSVAPSPVPLPAPDAPAASDAAPAIEGTDR